MECIAQLEHLHSTSSGEIRILRCILDISLKVPPARSIVQCAAADGPFIGFPMYVDAVAVLERHGMIEQIR